MLLKNEILLNDNLTKVLNNFVTYKIPALKAFSLLKFIKVLVNERKDLDAAKDNLIKKYGKEYETPNGSSYKIEATDKENMEAFIKDFNEILQGEFESGLESKIKLDFDKILDKDNNPVLLSVQDLTAIEPVFQIE